MGELTKAEQRKLAECEARIEALGIARFVRMSRHLHSLRESNPDAWPALCHNKFGETSEAIDDMIAIGLAMEGQNGE